MCIAVLGFEHIILYIIVRSVCVEHITVRSVCACHHVIRGQIIGVAAVWDVC